MRLLEALRGIADKRLRFADPCRCESGSSLRMWTVPAGSVRRGSVLWRCGNHRDVGGRRLKSYSDSLAVVLMPRFSVCWNDMPRCIRLEVVVCVSVTSHVSCVSEREMKKMKMKMEMKMKMQMR